MNFLTQNEYESLLAEIFRQSGIDPAQTRRLLDSRWPLVGMAAMQAEAAGRGFTFEREDLEAFLQWSRDAFPGCVPDDAEDLIDVMACKAELFAMFQHFLELTGRATPTDCGAQLNTPRGRAYIDAAMKTTRYGAN